MKKSTRFLCVVLAIVLICVPLMSVTAGAMKHDAVPVRNYPTIEIPGFMAFELKADKNDPESENIWPISSDYILEHVKELLPMLAKFSVTWNWDKLGKETTPVLHELLGTALLPSTGAVEDNSGVYFVYPPASSISRDSIVTFKYDWRRSPVEIADELNNFIEYICKSSGSDKVCITTHSLGGVVTLSYVTKYGDSRIQSLVMNTTAVFGETYNGELMTGKIKLNGEGIKEYVQYAIEGNEYEELVDEVTTLLDDLKMTDFIAKFGDLIVKNLQEYWIPGVLVPMFAHWPAIWAMVPDEYLEEAKNYVFNVALKDSDEDYSELIERIDSFQVVRDNRVDNLNKLSEETNFYVISRYGYGSVPVTPSWDSASDGVIDTKYSSYGATLAPYGKTLSDEYIANVDAQYISPDKTLDASTCMFPDRTWYIKNIQHSNMAAPLDDMMLILLHYDGQATTETFEQYPRFLEYSITENTLTPDTTSPAVKPDGFKKFIAFFKNYFNTVKTVFRTIIKLIKK